MSFFSGETSSYASKPRPGSKNPQRWPYPLHELGPELEKDAKEQSSRPLPTRRASRDGNRAIPHYAEATRQTRKIKARRQGLLTINPSSAPSLPSAPTWSATNLTAPQQLQPEQPISEVPPCYQDLPSHTAHEEPPSAPSYGDAVNGPDQEQRPMTLILRGRFVYPEENQTTELYQLSRALLAQGAAVRSIEFSRVDRRVTTLPPDHEPTIKTRLKALYSLARQPILSRSIAKAGGFKMDCQMVLESLSKQCMGDMTLTKPETLFHQEYRAEQKRRDVLPGSGGYEFVVKAKAGGHYRWKDNNRLELAKQVVGATTDEPEYRLEILKPQARRSREALVALWCLFLWELNQEVKEAAQKDLESRVARRSKVSFRLLSLGCLGYNGDTVSGELG